MADIRTRATNLFEKAVSETAREVRTIKAEHTARGSLNSSMTIIRITDAWNERSIAAVDEACDGMGKVVRSRGRRWRKMADQIGQALDAHYDRAAATIRPHFPTGLGNDALTGVDARLGQGRATAHVRLAEYRDGWRAPDPTPWHVRHPLLWAAAAAAAGALLAVGADIVKDRIEHGSVITNPPATGAAK